MQTISFNYHDMARFEIPIADSIFIGGSRNCDFCVLMDSIAPEHCMIFLSNNSYYLQDLGTGKKTIHNGKTLGANDIVELKDGTIQIGDAVFNIKLNHGVHSSKLRKCPSCNTAVGFTSTYCHRCGLPIELSREAKPKNVSASSNDVKPETKPTTVAAVGTDVKFGQASVSDAKIPATNTTSASLPDKIKSFVGKHKAALIAAVIILVIALLIARCANTVKKDSEAGNVKPSATTVATTATTTEPTETTVEATNTPTATPAPAKIDISDAEFGEVGNQIYTGSEVTFGPITMILNDEQLVEGTDYICTYDNNIYPGLATLSIEGINDCEGVLTVQYNIVTGDEVCDSPDNSAKMNFVINLYELALGRAPERDALVANVHAIDDGDSASEVVRAIFGSEEFRNRELSDEEFLNIVYLAVLDRAGDEGGIEAFLSSMDDGASRGDVVNTLLNSEEWINRCSRDGMND